MKIVKKSVPSYSGTEKKLPDPGITGPSAPAISNGDPLRSLKRANVAPD